MKPQISLWVAAILAVVATTGLQAQTYHYPPIPDFNHDGYVNAQNLLDFLPFYETQWAPLADYEAPDYEFADFQQAVYDVWNENRTLVLVEQNNNYQGTRSAGGRTRRMAT